MLVALLVAEGGDDLLQRKAPVDDRLHAVGVDGADHVELLPAASDQDALQLQLLQQGRDHRELAAEPGENADQRDMAADPGRDHGLVQRGGTADIDDMIDAAPTGEAARDLAPVRIFAVIDQMIRAEPFELRQLFGARRGGDDRRAGHFGELQREDGDASGALDQNGLAGLEAAVVMQRAPGGQAGGRQCRGFGVRKNSLARG